MKFLQSFLIAVFLGYCVGALADAAYPYSNATYIPTAISPPQTFTAPGDYTLTTHGLSISTLRITGTCTSLAATVQGSNDATNWTSLNLSTIGHGSSTVDIASTGFWRVNSSGLSKIRLHITALTATCTVAMTGSNGSHIAADPCADQAVMKSSVAINQSTATTAAIVAAAAGKRTYVCGFVATASGTTPTFTFSTGTHTSADCDTGASNLTGAMVPSATVGTVSYSPNVTAFSTAAAGQLCLVTAATTSVQGVLTYVQK